MKKTLRSLFTAGILSLSVHAQTTWQVSSFVGKAGGIGYGFSNPYGVCTDAAGNVYVVNSSANKIEKITPGGVVTTLAGSFQSGSTDATGTAASFYNPRGICADAANNIYVADWWNNKIRKITPAGVVTTLAGSGHPGKANGTGAAASFDGPYDLCSDAAGNIYVSDQGNDIIRKITPAGVVTTFAGSGQHGSTDATGTAASFYNVAGICSDAAGNIYVADMSNHKIRKITPAGVVSTFAGSNTGGNTDGTGTAATFMNPESICIDASGNLYVGDNLIYTIRKITPAGVVTTVAGANHFGYADGVGSDARFMNVLGMDVDASGNIYFTDTGDNAIRKLKEILPTPPVPNYNLPASMCLGSAANYQPAVTGSQVGIIYQIDSSISVPAPKAICKNKNGVFVLSAADSVSFYDFNGNLQFTYNNMPLFQNVTAIAADTSNRLYVVAPDMNNPSIPSVYRLDAQGNWDMQFSLASYQLNSVSAMAFGPGYLYVVDTLGPYIDVIDTTSSGSPITITQLPQPGNSQYSFYKPTSMVFGSNGQLYLADAGNNTILARNASDNNYYVVDSLPGTHHYLSIDMDTTINNNVNNNTFSITSDLSPSLVGCATTSFPSNGTPLISHEFDTIPGLHLRNPMGNVYVSHGGTIPISWVANNGGNNVIRMSLFAYSISPPLPDGLHYNFISGNISGSPAAISPYTTYTIVTQSTAGTNTTTVAFSVVPPGPVSNSVGTTSSAVVNQADGLTVNYYNTSDCSQMISIQDAPGGTVMGNTIATQTVYPTIATFNADAFVGRVTEVATQCPDSALAKIQLNFTYQDIQQYNASVAPTYTLSNDTTNTMLVGVLQTHTTNLGSIHPVSHSPLTANWVQVSAHQGHWEIKFDVTKFSTFYMGDAGAVSGFQCANSSADTIVTTNAVYYWHNDSLYMDGDYIDTLVNAGGCDSICTLNLTFDQTTGIGTPLLEKSTSIYPNPSTGLLNININNPNVRVNNIRIVNLMGEEVYHCNGNNTNLQLNLGQLPKGYYLVSITSNQECMNKRILLE